VAATREPLDDGHAVSASAEVAVADAADEVAQSVGLAKGLEARAPADGRELLGLEDEVVVAVAVELDEFHTRSGPEALALPLGLFHPSPPHDVLGVQLLQAEPVRLRRNFEPVTAHHFYVVALPRRREL